MNNLYKKIKSKKINLTHVCEVGVYLPHTSQVQNFIKKDKVRASLVEADPDIIPKISEYFSEDFVTIYPYAIWDKNGFITLAKADASTFVSELSHSPALVNDKYLIFSDKTQPVQSKLFSEIDDGTIDLLCIDIEGCEWFVLKNLVSKPKIITVETHGKIYINPYIREITEWMRNNSYILWYKDRSDSVFVRNDVFTPSILEKINLTIRNMRIKFRRLRKKLQS